MADSNKRFPAYFPEKCPPDKAIDDERMLYRLCAKKIPNEKDFLSFYEINPEKHKNNFMAYGLSVFPSVEDCEQAKRKVPSLRRYKGVSYGLTNSDRGKTLETPGVNNPHHITWWVYEGVKPHTFFKAYSEGGVKDE